MTFDCPDTRISQLWKTMLDDIDRSFCVDTPWGTVFSAGGYGKDFNGLVFNRDIAYSGILGLNRLCPERMLCAMKAVRKCRDNLGFACFSDCGCVLDGAAGVEVYDMKPIEFFRKFHKASSINKTDDVVWLWAAWDLLSSGDFPESEFVWLYENGKHCFEKFYTPFYDDSTGLYYGQPTFIDVGGNGYPDGYNRISRECRNKCVWVFATSTNCLYYKALTVMSECAQRLGLIKEASMWAESARKLHSSIMKYLRRENGTFVYFIGRDGYTDERRSALGAAFSVLCGIVSGDSAAAALANYPVNRNGAPLIFPFYERDECYHNNSSWPFADTFLLNAMEAAYGKSFAELNLEILENSQTNGHFRELRDYRSGQLLGSSAQLWTMAAFINVCIRCGYFSTHKK